MAAPVEDAHRSPLPSITPTENGKLQKKRKRRDDPTVDSNGQMSTDDRSALRKQGKKEKLAKLAKHAPVETDIDMEGARPVGQDGAAGSGISPEEQERRERRERKERKRAAKRALELASSRSALEQNDEVERPKKKRKKDRNGAESVPSSSTAVSIPSTREMSMTAAPPAEVEDYLAANSITITSPSGNITPILSFSQVDVDPALKASLAAFDKPTPIQACAWPALLAGKDVVGIAETGSGKTLAFGIPALSHILSLPSRPKKSGKSRGGLVSVLVVAPTRELAIQTHETLHALGEPFGIGSVCLFGGVGKDEQKRALSATVDGRTTRIVVGTPGRILDLVNEGVCDISQVSYLVLDEADRMLDKGFENDIRTIIEHTSDGATRQTAMFSATWPESVRRLAATFQRDPVRVTVGTEDLTANSRVEQVVEVFDDPRSKDTRLTNLLKSLKHKTQGGNTEESRTLVFVLYKKEASRVEATLSRLGYKVGGIHGDLGQTQRMKALDDFKTGRTKLLVATDVAARGLDIPNVGTVINYSFPLTIEDYVHRIGRTGRGGKNGKSVTFFTGENHERSLAGELMRVLRDGGFEVPRGMDKFPNTIKKKEHSAYGAFYRDDIPTSVQPKKITFD